MRIDNLKTNLIGRTAKIKPNDQTYYYTVVGYYGFIDHHPVSYPTPRVVLILEDDNTGKLIQKYLEDVNMEQSEQETKERYE